MIKTIHLFMVMALAITTSGSCKKGQKGNDDGDSASAQKGYVKGKVTNAQGQPIQGAQVYISSTEFYNSGVQTTSDANGNYKIKIPTVNTLKAYAQASVNYNGKPYLLRLKPSYTNGFNADEAIVCDFKLVASGEVVGSSVSDDYYGGTVKVYSSFGVGDLANVVFTFKPQGSLIDGSAGQTITVHGVNGIPYLYNIPIGKYEVSAKHGTQDLKIRPWASSADYASSVILEFAHEGTPSLSSPITMSVDITN